jgi:hypothetical protein
MENRMHIYKLRSSKICSIGGPVDYAASVIKMKKEREIEDRKPALQEAMKSKLVPTLGCSEKYSLMFALATSETPENIANTAFNKCSQLFEDAAEASIDPSYSVYWHGEYKRAMVDEMRKGALDRTIGIVVEARARQRLAPARPPDEEIVKPEIPESGI